MVSYRKHSTSSKKEHFLGVAILLAFLLPHSNTLFLLVNPILCLLLVISYPKSRRIQPFVLMVLIPVVISLILNLDVASQKALMSTFTILLYLTCFPFVGQTSIRNGYLYFCLGYIIVSQLVYVLGISSLINFFEQAYPINEEEITGQVEIAMRRNVTLSNMTDYRLGGIYHNSNQCAKYLTLLLAFFFINNLDRKSRVVLIFSTVAFAGILFTGSRTGFVVSSLILFFGLFRQSGYPKSVRYIFIVLAVIGITYIVTSETSLRGLDVESGLHNSADSKWFTFLYYLENENSALALLFGHLDTSLFKGQYGLAMNNFDSEYGSLIYRFGFVGFFAFIYYLYMLYQNIDKSYRFFFVVCLWIISSTIIASYRTFFVFMLLLSIIYNRPKVLTDNSLHENK